MATEVFHLVALTRILDHDARLVEALGVPEVSALDESDPQCAVALRAKAISLLEDSSLSPAITLFRRRFKAEVRLDEVEVTFAPPKRRPDWVEPVTLRIGFARWIEGDLHQAYVPALGVLVFATSAPSLPERVQQHVRLVLAGRHKQLGLHELASVARVQSLALGTLDVTAQLKTPKQLAEQSGSENKEPSMLATLAEELPPFLTTKSQEKTRLAPPCAYEMELELTQLSEALTGLTRRSVLLIGPAGGGKTALVHDFARQRNTFGFGATPFWSTNGARLMQGPIGFGMWQDRCQQLCREAAKGQAIVHLGSVAELLEVGKAKRSEQSVGGFLRPWIARGEITVIAECTPEQLGAIERIEPHLLGLFRKLTIAERTPLQTRRILARVYDATAGQTPTTAGRSSVDRALERVHHLHERYATYSANPGHAIRFLKNLLTDLPPEEPLTETAVVAAFSRESGLPRVLLDDQMPLDLETTRQWFAERVIGQPEPVARVLDLLALTKARLSRPRKPLVSLLFIGPTGTGKTEMAKALAAFIFGDASRMVRFDLNEFSDPVSVQRLIGGAGGGDAEGLLTARVREQPFSVLLLDEFEKADLSFFDLLLQILGHGRLTDAAGRVADFCNCVIVMTSNLGAQGFQRGMAGFRGEGSAARDVQEHFSDAVQKFLRPEIFNRLDAVVPFQPLSPDVVLAIAQREIIRVLQRDGVLSRPVQLQIDPKLAAHLAAHGYDARYGARPLKRAIEREFLVPLAESLSAYDTAIPLRVDVWLEAEQVRISVRARAEDSSTGAGAPEPAPVELVGAIVGLRRRTGRLLRSSAMGTIENRVTMLETIERRLLRAERKAAAPDRRLSELPSLRVCFASASKLLERASTLEDVAVSSLYRSQPLDQHWLAAQLGELEVATRRQKQEVFRLQRSDANDVVLAFYSEHKTTLFRVASSYRALAERLGKVLSLEAFKPAPKTRSAAVPLLRERVENAAQFFAEPTESIIGIIMHLRGDLFQPRFEGEAGRHEIKEKNLQHVCLIQVAHPPMKDYGPPKGIERRGGVAAQGAKLRRTFDGDQKEVSDVGRGRSPWNGGELDQVIQVLTEADLDDLIEQATR